MSPQQSTSRFLPRLLLLAASLHACSRGGEVLHRPDGLSSVRGAERFDLHSDLAGDALELQVRWFGAFWDWFEARYFEVPPGPKLQIWLFGDGVLYREWSRATGRGDGPAGFYAVTADGGGLLVVDLSSGLGTATHELVHHFVWRAFGDRAPHWWNEGFAAFFEKFLARLADDGSLELSVGYFSNWRFPICRRDVEGYSLAQLFAAGRDVDQCAARSLVLFLHRQRKLPALVEAMRTRTGDPDGSEALERAFGAPLAELEAQWKQWIRDQPLDADVALVPQSLLLTEAQWREWWPEQEGRLVWSDERQRYVPR